MGLEPTGCDLTPAKTHSRTWLLPFFFFFFRAIPAAFGCSQAKGQIRATAAPHSHSNTRSLTHWVRPAIEPASSWILVRFVSTAPQQKLPWPLSFNWNHTPGLRTHWSWGSLYLSAEGIHERQSDRKEVALLREIHTPQTKCGLLEGESGSERHPTDRVWAVSGGARPQNMWVVRFYGLRNFIS